MPADNDPAGETMTFSSARQMFGAIRGQELTDPAPSKKTNLDDEVIVTQTKMTKPRLPEIRKARIT
ncbi:MAG: hypothetical protein ACYSTY_09565 [Planctomycetota bacterium]|jgi:hypothetical protein